ncbi:tRNA pseudouridine(55) synthase TruB [Borreliella spielmanii]|uniref:tRNA pseudouridine synthase B n=1 Tax=Borreliella spielmanii A14S TaxID=498742 RepID=B9X7I9_9SPIR|nr:tRNA pseudouridine(55) synthase TruB [Borreliella spielmanii]EEF84874.1 tRNA pseudouridine synthase B [Borreliella spielmanii A14S]WKC83848.1 tRNA pseudouridine(55) synthase TruB [Borreliella spielmanii]
MENGFLLVNKEQGKTSFETLFPVKKYFNTNHVGHAGTLDKFASGVLIALVGKYTKLASYFMSLDKEYVAEFRFGLETDTLDPNGRIVDKTDYIPNLEDISLKLKDFIGEIYQSPPRFSSIHINGSRAYKLALNGKFFEIKKRRVNVYNIQILSYDFNSSLLSLKISCSKGTYIRSIARDLAYSLNSCAYVSSLKRIKVGMFRLEESTLWTNLSKASLISLESLRDFEKVCVDSSKINLIKNGAYVEIQININELKILKSKDGEILAIIKGIGLNKYKYVIKF